MRLRRTIPAGLLDTGFASLASLVTSAYAARFFPAVELGAYALFLSAFILAAVIPTQLVLIPAEITTVTSRRTGRLGLLQQSWRLAGAVAVAAALVASTIAYVIARAPHDVLWALAITTAACAVVSPLQDHVRRTLHLAGASWRAATVSLVHLLSAIVVLAVFRWTEVADAWSPIGALALANVISLGTAFMLTRQERRTSPLQRYVTTDLMRSGRWLLFLEVVPTVATFTSYALLMQLAGAAALGYMEAARIISQPVFVLTLGINAVIGPRSVEAAVALDHNKAKSLCRSFWAILTLASLLYGAITIGPWWGNPLGAVAPKAYVVPGLVLASVLAYLILGLVYPYRAELIGSGRLAPLAPVAVLAAALQCAAALTAGWTGGFARPLGSAINGMVLLLGYGRYRRSLYRRAPAAMEEANRG